MSRAVGLESARSVAETNFLAGRRRATVPGCGSLRRPVGQVASVVWLWKCRLPLEVSSGSASGVWLSERCLAQRALSGLARVVRLYITPAPVQVRTRSPDAHLE